MDQHERAPGPGVVSRGLSWDLTGVQSIGEEAGPRTRPPPSRPRHWCGTRGKRHDPDGCYHNVPHQAEQRSHNLPITTQPQVTLCGQVGLEPTTGRL